MAVVPLVNFNVSAFELILIASEANVIVFVKEFIPTIFLITPLLFIPVPLMVIGSGIIKL